MNKELKQMVFQRRHLYQGTNVAKKLMKIC